jgi:hypothetical protein
MKEKGAKDDQHQQRRIEERAKVEKLTLKSALRSLCTSATPQIHPA